VIAVTALLVIALVGGAWAAVEMGWLPVQVWFDRLGIAL
jgi:hypothetical protein